ncbi:glycosyltransferase family 4 protein [Micromonospora mirobrigensis]|uniref:glycosyltransferase family 4 protein n=1 Tax=Micromonospora mirobrigensis TaxID=262898 RepID=UPI00159F0F08|nr:glycosyltransferase family 4 protein [Micromonospora mirobrigensis]
MVGSLNRGGAETVSLDICRAVPADEAHQTFVTLAGWTGSLADDFRATGAAVEQCPVSPRGFFAYRIWRRLRALRPDVVVAHVSLAGAVVLLAARLCGVPVRVSRMWSEGDGMPDSPPRRLQRALLRWLLARTATDVLGVTLASLRFAGDRPTDPRYRVLYNTVDTRRIAGGDREAARRRWNLPNDVPVLGYLGRAAPEKNRAFLVDVHRAARRHDPGARLLVAGPGGADDLRAADPAIGADPRVTLAGEVDEIGSLLAAVDVLLLPSHREGLPGVLLEALAAGVPVVANDLPCLREMVGLVDGLTLVPLAAGADAWARAALDRAGTDAASRDHLRRALNASPFTLDTAVRQWRALWRVDRTSAEEHRSPVPHQEKTA